VVTPHAMRRHAALAASRLLALAPVVTPELTRRAGEDGAIDAIFEAMLASPVRGALSDADLAHAQDWHWQQAEWAMRNNEPDLPSPDPKARFLGMLAVFRRGRDRR
jgi:hypothetical protein